MNAKARQDTTRHGRRLLRMIKTDKGHTLKDYQQWVYDKLSDWQETFRDELRNEEGIDENEAGWTSIEKLKQKLNKGTLTKDDYDSVLFYLHAKIAYEEDE